MFETHCNSAGRYSFLKTPISRVHKKCFMLYEYFKSKQYSLLKSVYVRICETSKDQMWKYLQMIEPIFGQVLSKNNSDIKQKALKYFQIYTFHTSCKNLAFINFNIAFMTFISPSILNQKYIPINKIFYNLKIQEPVIIVTRKIYGMLLLN